MADWLRVVLKQKIHWWGDDFGGAGSLPWTCMAATPERLSGGRTAHAHTFLSFRLIPCRTLRSGVRGPVLIAAINTE